MSLKSKPVFTSSRREIDFKKRKAPQCEVDGCKNRNASTLYSKELPTKKTVWSCYTCLHKQ